MILSYLEINLSYQEIKDILHLNQNSLKDYVSECYKGHVKQFNYLSDSLSYKDLLQLTLDWVQFSNRLKKSLFNALSYPIILYSLMYGLMMFFVLFLFPSLNSIISLFDLDLTLIHILQLILRIIFILFSLLNVIILFILLILRNVEQQRLLIIHTSKINLFQLIRDIYSYEFAQFLNLLISRGFSTKQALEIIKNGSVSRTLPWLATLTIYNLEKGVRFEESINLPFFDQQFVLLTKLGSQSNQFLELITSYISTKNIAIQSSIKAHGTILKTITYVVLALLIICMYQILLAPMSLMSTL